MLREGPHLGIDVRVEPIGLVTAARRLSRTNAAARRRSARRRSPGNAGSYRWSGARRPRCTPCGVAQNDAKDVGRRRLPWLSSIRRPAEIDLGLFAGAAFQTAERQGSCRLETGTKRRTL